MKPTDVPALPDGGGWPAGWWRDPKGRRLTCCYQGTGPRGRTHNTNSEEPFYLTGIAGEVFCRRHARGAGAPALEDGPDGR